MTKIQAALENTFSKIEDFIPGLAFKFWLWLTTTLDAHISVPGALQVIESLIEERDELKAENDRLRAEAEAYTLLIAQEEYGKPKSGPNRPNAMKLTPREVAEIRQMKRSGFSQKAIADIYDVNPATVSRIVRGQYYKTAAA